MDNPATTLLATLHGTVLELGPGTGGSLRHYAPDVRWIGVEPDARHRAEVRAEADRLGRGARVLPGRAERLDLPDASVDAVVATFVLCSVADQPAALAELLRVLRPGGRYVFAEHVAAPRGSWLRRAQHVCAAFGPCRPDRDTLPALERAGLDVLELHSYTRPGPFGSAVPHIAGAALRPARHERNQR